MQILNLTKRLKLLQVLKGKIYLLLKLSLNFKILQILRNCNLLIIKQNNRKDIMKQLKL